MFDRSWLFRFVHFSTSFWINFWTPPQNKNLVTCIRVANLLENFFLGFLGDFRSFFDETRIFHQIRR